MTDFATDPGTTVTPMTPTEMIVGLQCGTLNLGQLNWIFRTLFAEAGGAPFVDCNGATIVDGAALATCADLNAALSALADVYVSGLSSYNATTNTLSLSMSDGSTVDIDMTALLADAGTPPQAVSSTTAAGNADTEGTILGLVDKPDGTAATLADVTGADPRLATSFASLDGLFTNAAAEPTARGVMNTDGTLGIRPPLVQLNTSITDLTSRVDLWNGAHFHFSLNTPLGATLTIPTATPYRLGHTFKLTVGNSVTGSGNSASLAGVLCTVAADSFLGVLRTSQYGALSPVPYTDTTKTQIYIRHGETYNFTRSIQGRWLITPDHVEFIRGAGYRENEDGTYTAFGSTTAVRNGLATVALPFAAANTQYRPQLSMTSNNGVPTGGEVYVSTSNGGGTGLGLTSFDVYWNDPGHGGTPNVLMQWFIPNLTRA